MIFDHIGLFVRDIDEGRKKLNELLPISSCEEIVDDPGLRVRIQFCTDASGIRYELVAPFGEGNPVEGVLQSGKNILNHVAYRVSDIAKEIERMRQQGCMPLGRPAPALAFGGRQVVFFLTPLRFVVELIEDAV
jgi:methylmalonyl-CoA/ethylmalonyl-CoA epimerase